MSQILSALLAVCPKCGGTLYYDQDQYGPHMSCLQCGNLIDLMLINREYKPDDPKAGSPAGHHKPRS